MGERSEGEVRKTWGTRHTWEIRLGEAIDHRLEGVPSVALHPPPRPPVQALVPWRLMWWCLRAVRRSCVEEVGGRCSEGTASVRRWVDVVVKARRPFVMRALCRDLL